MRRRQVYQERAAEAARLRRQREEDAMTAKQNELSARNIKQPAQKRARPRTKKKNGK